MSIEIPQGALTALITPFEENGEVDWFGLASLIRFQISQGISGIVPTGTTGESSTLTETEHEKIIYHTLGFSEDVFVLVGCGSNCTAEAMRYIECAIKHKGTAVLLVDPYYNGPSSLELRKEYYGPIAKTFPNITIVPYIIPGRTGCALLPEDLAALNRELPNILAVKEATGDLTRMSRTRSLTSPVFQIFSGDDNRTFDMMTMPDIHACGVISVVSNIVPAAVQRMCHAILFGNIMVAKRIRDKLDPLFELVTVLAPRTINDNTVTDKFRNPLPIKTIMNVLGMPAGPCRQPLGKMSQEGLQKIRDTLSNVWAQSPEILQPIEACFDVNIYKRLEDDELWAKLSY